MIPSARRLPPSISSSDASYELVSHLASGGMAELYLARRTGDGADRPYVVLKRILPVHARNSHFVSMFLDEARLASRLAHPNIARMIDVGRTGETYFYTMEYVHGENLRDLLCRADVCRMRVPLAVALSIVIDAATGLHAAHEQRDRHGRPLEIVHRDVSPSNVMVGYDGAIKVVDFGIAQAADRMTETRSGTVKGKTAYLSPEQCRFRPIDRRSDVFSLGIVAWELLTQRRLFRHDSDYEVMHAIVEGAIVPPSAVRGEVPAWVDAVIVRALARDPDRRHPTAAALAAALRDGAASAGLPIGPPVRATFMAELFGARPEPWLGGSLESDTDVHAIDARLIPRLGTEDASGGDRDLTGDPELVDECDAEISAMRSGAADARPTFRMRAATADVIEPGSIELVSEVVAERPPPPAVVWPVSPTAPRRPRRWLPWTLAGVGVVAAAALAIASDVRRGPGAAPVAPVARVGSPPVGEPAAAPPVAPAPAPAPGVGPARSPAPVPETAPTATSARPPGPRTLARMAARRGRWADALRVCTTALRTDPDDVELTTVCGLASCALGRAATARFYLARLPDDRAREVERECVARGAFTSTTECDDDPTACR